MAGFKNTLFVFDKYDSKYSNLKKDFYFGKLPLSKQAPPFQWKAINDD